jgi:isopenicillin N synthase-like dioxygenase
MSQTLSRPLDAALHGKQVPFSSIPVVDFGRFLSGDDASRQEIARKIGDACRTSGFFYLQNHGIASHSFERVYEQAARFYALPLEAKMELYVGRTGRLRGYSPMLEEKLSAKGDLKESFDLCLEIPADDPDVLAGAHLLGPNVWPEESLLPGFREVIYDGYYVQVLALARQVLEAFALALDLPADYFASKTQKPMCNLRVLHYPPQEGVIDPDMLGCGAHTDYECFTLLAQSDAGGLQVRNLEGDWIEAPPIPGTFVVNIGDMMARWTNDIFMSTPHRVINRSGRERFSLPFFFGADFWANLECLPTCQSEENPPKYAPIEAGKYLQSRYDATFAFRESAQSEVEVP